ncbi:hypothetical protein H4R35_007613 [Dimargaris xerosporica]|nr:hypothetical protein H4R35_007613 [Dimargaris xerosporica]
MTVSEALERLQPVNDTLAFCSAPNATNSLGWDFNQTSPDTYFVAVFVHEAAAAIPHLMHELIRVVDVVGRDQIFLSIYGAGSTDATKARLLEAMALMQALGLDFHLVLSNAITPDEQRQVPHMVSARNQLLEPLAQYAEYHRSTPYSRAVFIDSTYFCAHSLLTLLATADTQRADLACGLDFTDSEGVLQFSDVGTARDIAGRAFDQDPADLVSDAVGRQRLSAQLPFQVRACWSGLAALNADALHGARNTTFRLGGDDECDGPETLRLAHDLARAGAGHVVVDPTVRATSSASTWTLLHVHDTLLPPAARNATASSVSVAYVEGATEVYCAPADSQSKSGTWVPWA